jgi:hypothetical protein
MVNCKAVNGKSGGYLQNYIRTDKKGEKNPIHL